MCIRDSCVSFRKQGGGTWPCSHHRGAMDKLPWQRYSNRFQPLMLSLLFKQQSILNSSEQGSQKSIQLRRMMCDQQWSWHWEVVRGQEGWGRENGSFFIKDHVVLLEMFKMAFNYFSLIKLYFEMIKQIRDRFPGRYKNNTLQPAPQMVT